MGEAGGAVVLGGGGRGQKSDAFAARLCVGPGGSSAAAGEDGVDTVAVELARAARVQAGIPTVHCIGGLSHIHTVRHWRGGGGGGEVKALVIR